jgi:hypothetical protein
MCVCEHDNLTNIKRINTKKLWDKWTMPKDKLIKFWLNLDEKLDEKLAKVCLALPGE